jgi:hypothetical protein
VQTIAGLPNMKAGLVAIMLITCIANGNGAILILARMSYNQELFEDIMANVNNCWHEFKECGTKKVTSPNEHMNSCHYSEIDLNKSEPFLTTLLNHIFFNFLLVSRERMLILLYLKV